MSPVSYPSQRAVQLVLDPKSFWGQWQETARKSTLPSLMKMLKDTGRWDMWDLEESRKETSVYSQVGEWAHLFWESDCAKWLEGALYFLRSHPDDKLMAEVDGLIDAILAAQQPSGYLNVNFTVTSPGKAWTNTRDMHEMYNAGHLFEAAVAHFELTGQRKFLDGMLNFVRHIANVFGPADEGKKPGYPGHPEIELALLRMYDATKEEVCLDLAKFFLSERGRDEARFFRDEQIERGEPPTVHRGSWPGVECEWEQQARTLIVDQEDIQGHAVRAGYLLTGLADLCVHGAANEQQHQALWRLYRNMMAEKASVTGGIGAISQWEGFARGNFQLPNGQDEGGCYNETCAGIAILMLSDRLLHLTSDDIADGSLRNIMDIAERVLFNASCTIGMSLNGEKFTYENRLASSVDDPCERFPYFDCSCCPPNVLRTLGMLSGYFWSSDPHDTQKTVLIHHYFTGELKVGDVDLRIKTEYPWSGVIYLSLRGPATTSCKVRIPAWSKYTPPPGIPFIGGYAVFTGPGEWIIDLDLEPRLIWSHPYTSHNTLTLAYGPLIYCLEDIDNPWEQVHDVGHFKDLTMHPKMLRDIFTRGHTSEESKEHRILQLVAPAAGRRVVLPKSTSLSSQGNTNDLSFPEVAGPPMLDKVELNLVFVPYYYRANRPGGKGMMRVSILNRIGWAEEDTADDDNEAVWVDEKALVKWDGDTAKGRSSGSWGCVVA